MQREFQASSLTILKYLILTLLTIQSSDGLAISFTLNYFLIVVPCNQVLCIQGFLTCRKHAERIILLVEMLQVINSKHFLVETELLSIILWNLIMIVGSLTHGGPTKNE